MASGVGKCYDLYPFHPRLWFRKLNRLGPAPCQIGRLLWRTTTATRKLASQQVQLSPNQSQPFFPGQILLWIMYIKSASTSLAASIQYNIYSPLLLVLSCCAARLHTIKQQPLSTWVVDAVYWSDLIICEGDGLSKELRKYRSIQSHVLSFFLLYFLNLIVEIRQKPKTGPAANEEGSGGIWGLDPGFSIQPPPAAGLVRAQGKWELESEKVADPRNSWTPARGKVKAHSWNRTAQDLCATWVSQNWMQGLC